MIEPTVYGRIVAGTFRYWCEFCCRNHTHGIGDDANKPLLGGRGAHCFNPASPHYGKGVRLALQPTQRGHA